MYNGEGKPDLPFSVLKNRSCFTSYCLHEIGNPVFERTQKKNGCVTSWRNSSAVCALWLGYILLPGDPPAWFLPNFKFLNWALEEGKGSCQGTLSAS